MWFTAIMRSFSLLQEAIVPYIPTLIGSLTQKLLLVSKVRTTRAFLETATEQKWNGCPVSSLTAPVSSHDSGHADGTQNKRCPIKGTFPKEDLVLKAGWYIVLCERIGVQTI